MRIIPAIDIIDGKCVRLTQGDYGLKKIYNENPLEVALSFEAAGLKFLHLVDLDGAKAGKVTNWKVIQDLTSKTNLKIDFGGGIKTEQEVKELFDSGISQVNLGSIAVKNQKMVEGWISKFGPDKIILSADVKNEMIAISGWTENASKNIENFLLDYEKKGIRYVTCTDISTDGMLAGPNVVLYKKLVTLFPFLNIIASGGVSSIQDLNELRAVKVEGVIVGKAIYEGRVSLEELKNFNQ
jgi:phosphoribosylformimino-5-aminoimidazole carboxamide ribotide isomerase